MNTDPIEAYIRSAAQARGIDPDQAVTVARSEGFNSYVGDNGSSFGPFQLHYGGVAPGRNAVSGLGDDFTKETGLDARDPNTVYHQIDFALDHAAQSGWKAWHGWKGSRWAGISKPNNSSPDPDADAAEFLKSRRDAAAQDSGDGDDAAKAFLEQRRAAKQAEPPAAEASAAGGVPEKPDEEPEDRTGLFGEMMPQIRAHPYIAGGLAAVGGAGLAAMAPELGIATGAAVGGGLLWNLLKEALRGTAIGTGMHYGEPIAGGLYKMIKGAE